MRYIKYIRQYFGGRVFTVLLTTFAVVGFANAATGLDQTFANGGKIVFNAGADVAGATSTAFAVAVDPVNGKIYVCGPGRLATSTMTGASVARFESNGTPDASFGLNGRQIIAFQSGGVDVNARANALMVLADGSVIIAGGVSTFGFVAKLTSTGVLDTTFGTGGSFISTFGGSGASLNAISSLGNGRFAAAGASGGNFLVAKFSTGGSLDSTFGTGGFTKIAFVGSDVIAGMAIQTGGEIVVAGRASNDCALARLNANGSLDTSFGTGGKVISAIVTDNPDELSEVLIQPDGKIIGLGIAAPNGRERHLLLRYQSNGMLDNTFGVNGVAGTFFGNNQEFVRGGKLLANGKIIVVGYIGRNATIARYNADGSPDRGFLCGGFGWVYFNSNLTLSYFYDLALQPDGRMIAVGQATSSAVPQNNFALARFSVGDADSQCAANDFDRDGISDLSVVRPDAGGGQSIWYSQNTSGTFNPFSFPAASQYGLSTDVFVPADYDGDGKTDRAVFRGGTWWTDTVQIGSVQFGSTGDIPVPGDFDGDSTSDIAIFRPSTGTWWRRYSSTLQISAVQFGMAGDIPLIGDFDGDFRSDIAVFRPSNAVWYVIRSGNGVVEAIQFGLNGDIPLSGDFNGDGRSDLAVYRPSSGAWYIAKPTGVPSQNFDTTLFGIATDIPAPADYDGDGRTDIAVFRNGDWYILGSRTGSISYSRYGTAGDIPVASLR